MRTVLFLKFQENNWEENLLRAKEVLGENYHIIIVDGENTLLDTYKKIFSIAPDENFIMIEGDNWLLDNAKEILDKTFDRCIFKTINNFDIISVHGAVKILHKSDLNKLPLFSYDITINFKLPVIEEVISEHRFDTTEYNTFINVSKELLKNYFWGNYTVIEQWCKNDKIKKIWNNLSILIETISLTELRPTIFNKNNILTDFFIKLKKVFINSICKNEAHNVKLFLENVKDADKIIILDTGSIDNTPQIILDESKKLKIDDKVVVIKTNYEIMNFSKFRNDALVQMINFWEDGGLWIALDFDEVFTSNKWREKILYECFNSNSNSFFILRHDASKKFTTDMLRIFKSVDGYWEGRLHEGFVSHEHIQSSKLKTVEIQHLTTELVRTETKRDTYFKIIEEELPNNFNRYFYFYIEMLDHDFKDFDKITKEYFKNFDQLEEVKKISERQCVNMYQFFLRAFVKTDNIVPEEIINTLLKYKCRQIYFALAGHLSYSKYQKDLAKIYFEKFQQNKSNDFPWISDAYCNDQDLVNTIRRRIYEI